MDAIEMAGGILQDAFGDVPVSTEIPFNRPERFVAVAMEGGASDGFIATPYLGITCWGTDDHDAQTMAIYATDALRDASLDHPWLSAAQLESLTRDEWTATGQARYYARVRLTVNLDE